MSDTLTIRVPVSEKVAWKKAAETVHEELSEFARNAVRQRVAQVEQKGESPWDKHNEHGITWGDVMEGIMMAKGSKDDWWFELIVRLEAKIDGQKLFITFDCDHGS